MYKPYILENMKFDKDSLYKLGKLSKIKIDESKLQSLSSDLGSIVEFIDRLKSIDTENVDPTSNSLDQSLVMRDDIASDVNSANEILVYHFLSKKLQFLIINKIIMSVLNDKNYKKYAIRKPKNINHIIKIDKWARETAERYVIQKKIL